MVSIFLSNRWHMMKRISVKILEYGEDILRSGKLDAEKEFIQHGTVSCYDHSLRVANISLGIARVVPFWVDKKSLIRGALLHDYFLYDWHVPDKTHRLHGIFHARTALKNAGRDFKLNRIEQDIIKKHMFPLTITPPKYRESWIDCCADKLCAAEETVSGCKLFFYRLLLG